jgi:hypothetical protein
MTHEPSRRFRTLTVSDPFGPHPRSSRHSIHIGHALGSGFVQSIFSPASRRRPFECFPSASRRDADLKILCNIPSSGIFRVWVANLLCACVSLRGTRNIKARRETRTNHIGPKTSVKDRQIRGSLENCCASASDPKIKLRRIWLLRTFRSANRFYNAPNAFKAVQSAWSSSDRAIFRRG